jgi:cell wall-associated NlpC family hydrolase
MRTTALTDDGWAILALPHDGGGRDLACAQTWERSLKRSQLRRHRAATERRNLPASRKVGVAIAASAILAPLAQQTASAQETATTSSTTTATTASSSGLLRQGASGPEVSRIQSALGISADGAFGPATKAAVIAYQQRNGLMVDGIVGPQTRGALFGGGGTSNTSSTGSSNDSGPKPSQAVTVAVQQKLGLSADGAYGPQTRSAVKAFQARNGLEADGIVGPATMSKLGIAGSTTTEPAPASSGGGGSAVSAARSVIGTPYAYGGSQPGGFDCSGLVVYAFQKAGISLPRTSFAQFGAGSAVDRANIQAGDLVFFNANGPGASHVGIATSNSTVISATTHGVMEHAISDSYWGSHYVGARRV